LLVTVTTLACGAAFAQDEPAQTQAADDSTSSIFMQLDANQDGSISSEEAQASPVVARSFAKADANGDGSISRDEFMGSFTTRAPGAVPPAESTPPPEVPPPQ
jgi:Ca2+-binding EF-hand superfamily protein